MLAPVSGREALSLLSLFVPGPPYHQARSPSAGERPGDLGIGDSEMSNHGTGDPGVGSRGVGSPRAVVTIYKPQKSFLGNRILFLVALKDGTCSPREADVSGILGILCSPILC